MTTSRRVWKWGSSPSIPFKTPLRPDLEGHELFVCFTILLCHSFLCLLSKIFDDRFVSFLDKNKLLKRSPNVSGHADIEGRIENYNLMNIMLATFILGEINLSEEDSLSCIIHIVAKKKRSQLWRANLFKISTWVFSPRNAWGTSANQKPVLKTSLVAPNSLLTWLKERVKCDIKRLKNRLLRWKRKKSFEALISILIYPVSKQMFIISCWSLTALSPLSLSLSLSLLSFSLLSLPPSLSPSLFLSLSLTLHFHLLDKVSLLCNSLPCSIYI